MHVRVGDWRWLGAVLLGEILVLDYCPFALPPIVAASHFEPSDIVGVPSFRSSCPTPRPIPFAVTQVAASGLAPISSSFPSFSALRSLNLVEMASEHVC